MAVKKNALTAYLFVYGSLRRTCAHPLHKFITQHAEYTGEGWLQARLYRINDYPGAVLSDNPQHRVYGELYRLRDSETVFAKLDAYEECSDTFTEPHEYQRLVLPIFTGTAQTILAWTYIYNHPVTTACPLESGDWLMYLHAKPESDKLN